MSPVNVNAIGAYIREQREQAKISLRQLAQQAGVSNPYLSQVERGLRRPSADILQQIAKGLRISAEALYVQAGILDDRPPGSGVREAVLGDAELSERQKQMLLEVYESFRKENATGGPARTVLIGEALPAGETAPADGTAPAGETVPSGEAVPSAETVPGDPVDKAAAADEAPQADDSAPDPGQDQVA
jgi:transcriptional regulator with XRE-family HTH domain